MRRTHIPRDIACVVTLALLVGAAPVAGQGTTDRAKSLVRCHEEVFARGRKLLDTKLRALDACAAAVFTCIQTKPGNARCAASASARCTQRLGPGVAAEAARFTVRVGHRCGPIRITDLLGPTGVGYDAIAGSCASDFSVDVTSVDALARCLVLQIARSAETLFAAERPRARELIVRESGVDPSLVSFLPELGATREGEESAKLEAPVAKQLVRCSAAMAKAGTALALGTLANASACLDASFHCSRRKPGDPSCITEALRKCRRQRDQAGKRPATLEAAVRRQCDVPELPFDTLRSLPGANLNGLGCECQALDLAPATRLGDSIGCLARQHACRMTALARVLDPGADTLLAGLGMSLRAFADCPPPATQTSATLRTPRQGRRLRFGDLIRRVRAAGREGNFRSGVAPSSSGRRGIVDVRGGRIVRAGGTNVLRVNYFRGIALSATGIGAPEAVAASPEPAREPAAQVAGETPTLVVRADVFEGLPITDFVALELPPDPPPGVITTDCTLDTCTVDVTVEFADELGSCAFQPAFALAENAAAAAVSAYVPFEQIADSPAAPRRVLVMPFDATNGKRSVQSVSRIGDGLQGSPVATHWAYFAADGRLLADVRVCLVPDDTAVLDVSQVQGQRQTGSPPANVGIGPVVDLTGERGIVIVSAYRGDSSTGCAIVDPSEISDPDAGTDVLVGTWRIADPLAATEIVGDPIGFVEGQLLDSRDFGIFEDARLLIQTADPDALASSRIVVVGLESGAGALPDFEIGPIPRGSDDLGGSHACCDVSFVDETGLGMTLPPFCFDGAGFAPLTDALAGPGEVAIVPADVLAESPGFLRIGECMVADLDGTAIPLSSSFIHAVYAFHGQVIDRGLGGASSAKFETLQNPIVGDPPSGALVMPFDATPNKISAQIVSRAGVPLGDRVATHWVYWAADGRFLAETIVCLEDDATIVVDPTRLPGSPAPIGTLTGERGFVTVHAYPAGAGATCTILDLEENAERSLIGTWFIGNTATLRGFGNDAIGLFGDDGTPTSFEVIENAFFTDGSGATLPTFDADGLADSDIIVIGIEAGPESGHGAFLGLEAGPIPRSSAALAGARVCCRARLTNDRGASVALPDFCLAAAGFAALTTAVSTAGDVALVPPTLAVDSPGLIKLHSCVTPGLDDAIIKVGETDQATQFLLSFHGQSLF